MAGITSSLHLMMFPASQPNDEFQVRFTASDTGDGSVVEAGVDAIVISTIDCENPDCPSDIDGNGAVDVTDLLAIIGAWGNTGGPEDIDGNGSVDVGDLLAVISAWGGC